ncbi:hypothetical protein BTHE68_70420 (plasmid) [Burkholderia sp. THE68]|nr:hypothetical protein BTHE68_70420 [Burkholderia sp. THE68]
MLALRYHWRNNSVVCVHNFSAAACTVKFRVGSNAGENDVLVNLLSDDHSQGNAKGQHTVVLEPYGYRWFRAGGLDYLLKRSEV